MSMMRYSSKELDERMAEHLGLGREILGVDSEPAPRDDGPEIDEETAARFDEADERTDPPSNVVEKRDAVVQPVGWTWKPASAFFERKPAPKWTVKDLGFAPGRPCLIVGPSSSAKTLLMQSLELSLAAGRPIWQCFGALEPMTVAGIDVDLGEADLDFRFRRLIAGWPGGPLGAEEIGSRLKVVSFPSPSIDLMKDSVRELLKRELDGVQICFGDALRGLASGDENASEFRRALDMAAAVSNDTKCCFVFTHHTGHPQRAKNGKQIENDQAGRGSSAIKDGAGAVLKISGSKKTGRTVSMLKPPGRTGVEWEAAFRMTIEAVAAPDWEGWDPSDAEDERVGLRVSLTRDVPNEESAAPADADEAARQVVALEHDRREAMLAILRAAGSQGYAGGVQKLVRATSDALKSRGQQRGIRDKDGRELFDELVAEGVAAALGTTNTRRLYLKPFAPQKELGS